MSAQDGAGDLRRAASITPQSQPLIDEVVYEGYANYRITMPSATWFLDRASSGFSRLVDRQGRDWIFFHISPPH
jgi:hypothetical protein